MIRWAYAFIDRPIGLFKRSCDFWTMVTGTTCSAPRGESGEFVTLLPPTGDQVLKLQGVHDCGGAHLDLAVEDVPAGVRQAQDLGATIVSLHPTWVVLRSPGGKLFCIVGWHGETVRPPVLVRPEGTRSTLDQVCIDVPTSAYDAEAAFWRTLTGPQWRHVESSTFSRSIPPGGLPIWILVQRLDSDRPTSAHLDMACTDPTAVRIWHEECGARTVAEHPHWFVMEDPTGGVYCLSDRLAHLGDPG